MILVEIGFNWLRLYKKLILYYGEIQFIFKKIQRRNYYRINCFYSIATKRNLQEKIKTEK